MIRVRGLKKAYRTRDHVNEVLRDVDFEIEDGEFVAVVGRSGSGKTTLINVIGGLDRRYEGTVEVDEQDLRKLTERELASYRNERVGFVFQSFHLLEHLTLAENAALPASFTKKPISRSEARERALEVLDKVGLKDRADDLPTNLSGGQKQRVAIARALFNRPQLVVCDEPTGNLDAETADAILELFAELRRDEGVTLVVVTHDDLIAHAAERCIRVHDGGVAPYDPTNRPRRSRVGEHAGRDDEDVAAPDPAEANDHTETDGDGAADDSREASA